MGRNALKLFFNTMWKRNICLTLISMLPTVVDKAKKKQKILYDSNNQVQKVIWKLFAFCWLLYCINPNILHANIWLRKRYHLYNGRPTWVSIEFSHEKCHSISKWILILFQDVGKSFEHTSQYIKWLLMHSFSSLVNYCHCHCDNTQPTKNAKSNVYWI